MRKKEQSGHSKVGPELWVSLPSTPKEYGPIALSHPNHNEA